MMMNKGESSVSFKHNIEIAHRLSLLPGKCQQIHGHGMIVEVDLTGQISKRGLLFDVDFGKIKDIIRSYLNKEWDHRLHLNQDDRLAEPIFGSLMSLGGLIPISAETKQQHIDDRYPGAHLHPGDPTTENIARWIGEDILAELWAVLDVEPDTLWVEVTETIHNSATWSWERDDEED